MSEAPTVVCPRCGKKYKLKEGFNAAAFACKECGATVKVAKTEAPVPTRAAVSRTKAPAARASSARAPSHARAGRGRRGDEESEGEERRHGRHAPKKASGAQVGLAIAGLAILVGLVAFFALRGDKTPPATTTATAPAAGTTAAPAPETAGAATPPPPSPASQPGSPAAGSAAPANSGSPANPVPPPSQPPAAGTTPPAAGEDEALAPKRKLGGSDAAAKAAGKSRYDPPAEIPHLDTTSPEERELIDKLIGQLMDPDAGKDSLKAKERLVLIGKPAFPRVVAAMAKIRDVITDVDSMEERMLESSLRLADQALREMDGYLNGHNKPELRPGSDKKYIEFVCRMHYKRWVTELSKMEKMPGPFDPSVAYTDQIDEEEESGK